MGIIRARPTIAMFGEAEKGEFSTPLYFKSLMQLAESLGNPPKDSQALYWAVQALLYKRDLIFIRVKEEGFSRKDYIKGLKLLKKPEVDPTAIFLPGVGDVEILSTTFSLCKKQKSFLLTTEKDLYDFLTAT